MAKLDVRDDWFKTLVVGAPLFASSLAITYDVGFFFGADIGFFTFFSVSEHVVFALQAIPFLLVPALGIIGMIGVTWFGYHKTIKDRSEVMAKFQQMGPEERETFIAKLNREFVSTVYSIQLCKVHCSYWLSGCSRSINMQVRYCFWCRRLLLKWCIPSSDGNPNTLGMHFHYCAF
jgi:hypothetical protein